MYKKEFQRTWEQNVKVESSEMAMNVLFKVL